MDASFLPSTLSARQEEIVVALETHAAKLLDLKFAWNELLPVSRLPPEVLVMIFDLYAAYCFSAASQEDHDPPRTYTWIRCTHVCRRWRQVALSTPWLWRRVCLTSLDWSREVLARSANVPLQVNLTADYGEDRDKSAIALICEQFPRTCEAHVRDTDLTASTAEYAAPLLRSLEVSGTVKPWYIRPFESARLEAPCTVFCKGGLPMLTRLEVTTCTPVLLWSLLQPSLQVLRVNDLKPTAKIESWLHALSELPNLRDLELDLNTPDARYPSGMKMHPDEWSAEKVVMPNLTRLMLRDDTSGRRAASLLEKLVVPKVESAMLFAHNVEDLPHDKEAILSLIQQHAKALSPKTRFTWLDVHIFSRQKMRICLESLTYFDDAPYIGIGFMSKLSHDALREVFEALPEVTSLKLHGEGRYVPEFMKLLRPPERGEDGTDPATQRQTLLPNMRWIRICEDLRWDYCGESIYDSDEGETLRRVPSTTDIIGGIRTILRERRAGGVQKCYVDLPEELEDLMESDSEEEDEGETSEGGTDAEENDGSESGEGNDSSSNEGASDQGSIPE